MSEDGLERYGAAERRLWVHFGVDAKDHSVALERPRKQVPVREVGKGAPGAVRA
jgi:hypothetical protein